MSGELLIRCIITGRVTITEQGLTDAVLPTRYKTGEVMVPCAAVNTAMFGRVTHIKTLGMDVIDPCATLNTDFRVLLGKGTNRFACCTFYYSVASLHVCKGAIR